MPDSDHHHNGAETIIRLFEEKLIVERAKRKVGEIVIRKEIDTEFVEVPVYREKLIVERVTPEPERLAEIEIGQTRLTGQEKDKGALVTAEFNDLHVAVEALKSFARQELDGYRRIRIQFVLEDESKRSIYQNFLDRWSKSL